MTQKLLYGLAFFMALLVSTVLGYYTRDRVTKKIDNTLPRVSVATTVQNADVDVLSVPEIETPASVQRFNAPSVSIYLSATLLPNGTVSDITPHSGLTYEVAIRGDERFPRLESEDLVNQVRDDVIRVVTEQIRGIKFGPKIVDGKATSSNLRFLAKFSSLSERQLSHYMEYGGSIELTIESDLGLLWKGDVTTFPYRYHF